MESALHFEHNEVLAHKTRGHTILRCFRGMALYSLNQKGHRIIIRIGIAIKNKNKDVTNLNKNKFWQQWSMSCTWQLLYYEH